MDPSDQQSKPSVSLYVKGLDREARDRYRSKLQFEKKTRSLPDPFGIPHLKWENDPTKWPCLEFAQVFVYLIETPALYNTTTMKNYKSLEAYRYVVSGHVQEVLFFDVKDSPFCFLKAGVLPSMRTRDDPHDAWVCLSKDLADVYCAHCTCMAGLGETCSHVAAVLFKIELGVRYGLTQTSVTSEGCKWNQLFKKQVNPSTIQDMQHIMNTNRKKTVESVIPTGKDPLPNHDVLLSLYKVCPTASFFTLIPPVHPDQQTVIVDRKADSLPTLLTNLYDEKNKMLSDGELSEKAKGVRSTMACSKDQIEYLFKRTQTQNVSPLWYEHRNGRVTGTKSHDILVRKDATLPDNLTMRIMDYKSYDLSKKEAVRWGLDKEATATKVYSELYATQHADFTCKPSGFRIAESNPFCGATADGIVTCSCCGLGTLEVKCPFKHRNVSVQEAVASEDKAFCLDRHMHLKTTHRYFTQVQFQMFAFDCLYCDFVVMTLPESGPSLVVVRILRDQPFIDHMVAKCDLFITNYVIPELLTGKLKDVCRSGQPAEEKTLWCICSEPEYGKMIQCNNGECQIGWFHYSCVNVKRKPRGKWLCPKCKK